MNPPQFRIKSETCHKPMASSSGQPRRDCFRWIEANGRDETRPCTPDVYRSGSTHTPAHSFDQRHPWGPLLAWQRRGPQWGWAHEPGRDLTATRDANNLGRRVVTPTLRAGPEALTGLPAHADEPPWTPDRRAAKPCTRRPAFDLP